MPGTNIPPRWSRHCCPQQFFNLLVSKFLLSIFTYTAPRFQNIHFTSAPLLRIKLLYKYPQTLSQHSTGTGGSNHEHISSLPQDLIINIHTHHSIGANGGSTFHHFRNCIFASLN